MDFPTDFIFSIRALLGDDTIPFLSSLTDDASIGFRLNPFKAKRNPMEVVVSLEPVPWSRWGFYLNERPSFTFDPLFHAGYYYVQEASSMFIEHVVNELVTEPSVCLDLCAAPGGKSVSLLPALPSGSLLVSNELIRQRAHVLSETMTKFGHPHVMVTNNRPLDFIHFPHFFDLILVDAPCSGEGMFRKDETAIEEWSPQNVEMCAARQRDILSDIWPALKPGGLLIYSTCTYNTSENEGNSLWIADELGAEFVSLKINEGWGISPSFDNRVTGYRFFPHRTKGEGLYVTVLRKGEGAAGEFSSGRLQTKNKKKSSPFVKDRSGYSNLLLQPDLFEFMEEDNRVIALPMAYSDNLISLNEHLKAVSIGIEMGEWKGKDFIPSHSLAVSNNINPEVFIRREVVYEEAVSYLRREAIAIPDAPRGYLLLTYKGEPLGFVKNLGSRANNLYPNEWRIRSGYLPDKVSEIFRPHLPHFQSSNP